VDRFRVVICGGSIAAVEGLLRLRRLVGDAVHVTLVAPNDELRYRPVAVQEPFSRSSARRYPLRKIVRHTDAEWVQEALEWVDPDGQVAHSADGRIIPYDALLLAVGARTEVPYEHVTVFDDANADDTYRGVVQDVEEGYTRSVAMLLPEGPAWPLPIYELALMTAERSAVVRVRPSASCSSPLAWWCIWPLAPRCLRRGNSWSGPRIASSSPVASSRCRAS
jgi:sulfide:quinone oxidoreductase